MTTTTPTAGTTASCSGCADEIRWSYNQWLDEEDYVGDTAHLHEPKPDTVRPACGVTLQIGDSVRGRVNTGRVRTCGYPATHGQFYDEHHDRAKEQ